MKSTKIVIGSMALFAIIGMGIPAHAEEGGTVMSKTKVQGELRTKTGTTTRQNIKDLRENFREDRKEDREAFRATTTASTTRKEFREERREDRKDLRASTTQIRKDARRERAEKEIQKRGNHMIEMFNAAVTRLEKIATRIDSRIIKVKAEGKTTTEAEANLASARVSIAAAKADIALLPTAITKALGSTELKGSFAEVETLAKKIRGEIKTSHEFLVKAIVNLKGIGEGHATTTVNN